MKIPSVAGLEKHECKWSIKGIFSEKDTFYKLSGISRIVSRLVICSELKFDGGLI